MSRSDIRRFVTGKWRDKDSSAGSKILVGCGILLLLFIPYFHGNSILDNNAVFAQSNPSTSNPLTDRSPSFLEAYWTENSGSTSSSSTSSSNNNPIKKEVGPGEGASTLAIVLVNKGRSEITALTGYLTLPSSGFRAIEGENFVNSSNITVASHDAIVKPGEAFTLHFTIHVLDDVKVGAYSGNLKLVYSKVLETGQISSSIAVPFRITGKVILDAVSDTQNLIAGSPNDLRILIKNEGSADANGVIASVTGVTDGATTTDVSNSRSNMGSNDDESTRNNSDSDDNATASKSTANEETTTTEEGQELDSEASTISLQTTTFNVGNIPAGGSVLSISPVNTVTTSNLSNISNFDNEDNRNGEDSILLKAGKIEEVTFSVSNNGDTMLKDVVLSLDSSLDSVKILGDSRWTFGSMNALSKQELSTQVFAAEDVIATPIEFTINAEYISGRQSKTDSLSIGAYVDGEIKIKAYDFAVNDIGGTPNLVGNLLNQGNTIALFTTVEMINKGGANTSTSSSSTTTKQPPRTLVNDFPPQQYLGDLSENSPLPFSIPLNIDKNLPGGAYPVGIKVTYSDTLRNTHEIILNGTVDYTPKSDSSTESGGFLGYGELSSIVIPVVIILAIISVLVIIIIIRRRRKGGKRKTLNSKSEDRELFDDEFSSADNKNVGGVKQ